jgi:hypothetical protein
VIRLDDYCKNTVLLFNTVLLLSLTFVLVLKTTDWAAIALGTTERTTREPSFGKATIIVDTEECFGRC